MQITLEEFYRRYDAGERDFTGLELPIEERELLRFRGIPRGVILKRAKLSGAVLEEIQIESVDLSFADLSQTALAEAIFDDTKMEGANFQGAYGSQICFRNCNLRYTKFREACLSDVSAVNCDFSFASFKGAFRDWDIKTVDCIFHETMTADGQTWEESPSGSIK